MVDLAKIQSLVRIHIDFGKEIVYKACSLDDAKKWKQEKRDFTLIDWSIISSSMISRIESATPLEEFDLLIRPTLSVTAKDDFDQIKTSALASKRDISLSLILKKMDERRMDRESIMTGSRDLSEEEKAERSIKAKMAISQWRSRQV